MDGGGGGAAETVEQMQARHRKEAKDLQGRVTSKKKNATKKTRKGVNDECAELERQMKERQAQELEGLVGGGKEGDGDTHADDEDDDAVDDGREDTTQAELAAKMRAMGVGELAAKPPQRPSKPPDEGSDGAAAGGGGAGQGKKRNRQKERLARRAAEQEAAAEAAEQEAAGMTDHRGQERERMEAEFTRHGLEEHEIRPDGHCLFSAVADQLGQSGVSLGPSGADGEVGDGKEPGYKTVRRAAAGYIEARGDEFAGFLEEDMGSYVHKIRDTAEWGGQLELLALASVYGVEVCVVQDGRTEVISPSGGGEVKEGEERKKIWLAYYRHGYGLGEHYNSLRKKA
ncbi:otu domain-containing protein 6b [Diaporthe eres]|uniref:OTU domain-containing protein n=1 Tax=Diaporthe vaccinii TaxID=105482 RepID=A0ABR4F5A7_9PEZI|nr:otu domain-containing protein 6b [Diaporthe eres]